MFNKYSVSSNHIKGKKCTTLTLTGVREQSPCKSMQDRGVDMQAVGFGRIQASNGLILTSRIPQELQKTSSLQLRRYNRMKKANGVHGPQKLGQNEPASTAETLAKQHGVSPVIVAR